MMHSRRLYHFLAIAEAGSISGAAEELGVTQPALTRSLKQLEDVLGVSLMERRPTGIILTPEGVILARRVKLMNMEYQHALAEISDWSQGVKGRLNLAAGPVWMLSILPPIISEYHKLYPDIRISLVQGGFETQIEKLLSGDVDAVCGTLDFPSHAELTKEPLTRLRHTVIARAGHPLTQHPSTVSPEQLAEYPWVILSDDPISSSRIGAYFVANGLEPPNVVIETNALGALSIVRNGDFLTTYAAYGAPELEGFGITPIAHEGTLWDFEAGLVRLKTSRPGPALDAFRSVLRDHLIGTQRQT